MKALSWITFLLVIIGGLNWGLVGFFNFNLVESIFGGGTMFIYDLVGLAALYELFTQWGKR